MAWATATFHEEHARRREHESAIAASGMLAAMKSDCHLIIVIYSIDLSAMIIIVSVLISVGNVHYYPGRRS